MIDQWAIKTQQIFRKCLLGYRDQFLPLSCLRMRMKFLKSQHLFDLSSGQVSFVLKYKHVVAKWVFPWQRLFHLLYENNWNSSHCVLNKINVTWCRFLLIRKRLEGMSNNSFYTGVYSIILLVGMKAEHRVSVFSSSCKFNRIQIKYITLERKCA